jgi:aminopeptidase N
VRAIPIILTLLSCTALQAQLLVPGESFTRADTLRGSIGPHRAWWNVTHYDISVRPDIPDRSITGTTIMSFVAVDEGSRMQIDLQQPLVIDSMFYEFTTIHGHVVKAHEQPVEHERDGNVAWVDLPQPMRMHESSRLRIHYHGEPKAARQPPWDGGWVWRTDALARPWVSLACQGLGASVWYPCKDHQSDEPDNVASLRITVPDTLVAVGNGRLQSTTPNEDGTSTWHWAVTHPINTYNIAPYIGKYVHFGEVYEGVEGPLDLDYWVLENDLPRAQQQFQQVGPMMECFERMLGPFPWYADGYKLVQAPFLGMEHQSAIAYGNNFMNGYRGMDISHSGHGNKFDYIIVHESGHEWYGNSISTADIADMWVHEGFTVYTEVAYVECMFGKEAAHQYMTGMRQNIQNDRPVIGPYGVNEEGSNDMYYKGAAVVHMVRAIMDDDEAFWNMIREMLVEFKHSIVTSAQIEAFMDARTEADLRPMFDQYLRTTRIPRLEWQVNGRRLSYRWSGVPEGFNMPVDVFIGARARRLLPTHEWKVLDGRLPRGVEPQVDRRYYVTSARGR